MPNPYFGIFTAIVAIVGVYIVDRRYVKTDSEYGFWKHIYLTQFFPRRAMAYSLVLMSGMVLSGSIRENAPYDTATRYYAHIAYSVFIYPFLAMLAVCVVGIIILIIRPPYKDIVED